MSNEAVKVVVRCRPLFGKELVEKRKPIIICDTTLGTVAIQNPKNPDKAPKKFTFDAVYDPDSTQRNVYDETGYPLVESVMEGYNGTMFAYGQTGCGKTHTMQGKDEPAELRGIIPNSFDHIFENIKIATGKEFLVRCAYLEIYNEEIRDLLGADPKAKVDLKEDPERGVFVKGLTDIVVDSVDAIDNVMRHGHKNRTVGATLMNAESSRSHSIFTIIIEGNEMNEAGQDHFTKGKLNLVDLAGSERPSKTGATGARMKEGIKINLSLTALGNVISALVDGKPHIPYRDSKLTRLLQDSLGGNTKTVMMAAISPADYNHDETLSTLRYANRAKNIKNKPVVNEDPKDALLRQYKDEIERLKSMLEAQAAMAGNGSMPASMGAPGGAPSAAPTAPLHRQGSAQMEAEANDLRAQIAAGEAAAVAGAGSGAGAGAAEPKVVTKVVYKDGPAPEPKVITKTVEKVVYRDGPAPEPQIVYKDGPAPEPQIVYKDGPAPEPKVVTKTVEKVVQKNVEVVPKQLLQQQAAMQNYNKSIVEQRNRMGAELQAKAEEIERERREREAIQQRLQALQSKVMGTHGLGKSRDGGAGGGGDDGAAEDPEVILAKQQAEHRKAQLRLKREKKRQAKLKVAQQRALEAQRQAEEESKTSKEEAVARAKELKKVKAKYSQRIKDVQQELVDTKEEFDRHRDALMNTVREQTKETKLLEQLIALFLPSTEMGKIWERAVWNEEREEWTLPTIKPRKQFSQVVKLPTLGGGGDANEQVDVASDSTAADTPMYTGGGVVVSDDDDAERRAAKEARRAERRRRKRREKEKERARRKAKHKDRPKSGASRSANRQRPSSEAGHVGSLDMSGVNSAATSPRSAVSHRSSNNGHASHRSSAPQLHTPQPGAASAGARVLASGGDYDESSGIDEAMSGADAATPGALALVGGSLASSPEFGGFAPGGTGANTIGIAGLRRHRKERLKTAGSQSSSRPPLPKGGSNNPTPTGATPTHSGGTSSLAADAQHVMQGAVPPEISDGQSGEALAAAGAVAVDASQQGSEADAEAEKRRRKEERKRRKERHLKKKRREERRRRRAEAEANASDAGAMSTSAADDGPSEVEALLAGTIVSGSGAGDSEARRHRRKHRHKHASGSDRPSSRSGGRRRRSRGQDETPSGSPTAYTGDGGLDGTERASGNAMGGGVSMSVGEGGAVLGRSGSGNGHESRREGSSSRRGGSRRGRSTPGSGSAGSLSQAAGNTAANDGAPAAGDGSGTPGGNRQYVAMLERCWSPDGAAGVPTMGASVGVAGSAGGPANGHGHMLS